MVSVQFLTKCHDIWVFAKLSILQNTEKYLKQEYMSLQQIQPKCNEIEMKSGNHSLFSFSMDNA